MREPDSDKPCAIVVAASRGVVRAEIEHLKRGGFNVRFHGGALDALASFGEDMPLTAVLGPLDPHPANVLLMEDLDRYGVPVVRAVPVAVPVSPHGRRAASSRAAMPHRSAPATRGGADGPAHR
ncbi:hypothetical protein [Novosphingobium lindaniclasticum]|uniref:hypothetical protein n=1 Tax=Novosphingobium lindaniclasticum TaxID=1329895 RepID=UPI000408F8FE|nr:hypothetical protein [Novosphingobium lindaniclasticum]